MNETMDHYYDARLDAKRPKDKTEAQQAVDFIKSLGANHIILNARGYMTGPHQNDVFRRTHGITDEEEKQRFTRLITYIHQQGMSVGIRPIFLLVDNNGNPVQEVLPNGKTKTWWHGVIQPYNPAAWMESYRKFLMLYADIARRSGVEEFTIGAELQSMTVGDPEWKASPYGHAERWASLVEDLRTHLPGKCRVMYDINYTDDSGPGGKRGGELEVWVSRIISGSKSISKLWKTYDAIGIDVYRSLGKSLGSNTPSDYTALYEALFKDANNHAYQLKQGLTKINAKLKGNTPVYIKEIGYRSTTQGFIDPYEFDDPSLKPNIMHQAAAFKAFFKGYWNSQFLSGVALWDVAVDPRRSGSRDPGFALRGKDLTNEVIQHYFSE